MRPSPHGFVNQMLLYTLLTIGFTGSIGMASVWMRYQISVTANANNALESRIVQVERLTQQTNTWIAEEQDETALQQRNTAWHLGLVPVREDQVARMTEDPMMHLAAKRDRGLFKSEIESVSFRVALH